MRKRAEIILLDDDPLVLETLRTVLEKEYGVHSFTDPMAAEDFIRSRHIDLAVLDLNLHSREPSNGLEILKEWKRKFPELEILFCSGEVNVARAIECLRQGASDYIVKPFQREDFLLIVRRILEKQELKSKVEKLRPLVLPHPIEFIASSGKMKDHGRKGKAAEAPRSSQCSHSRRKRYRQGSCRAPAPPTGGRRP